MKKNFKLSVFIFMFSLSYFVPIQGLNADSQSLFPITEPSISMDFQDASLKDLLKIFSVQSGLNFIASESVQDRRITLYLDKVPLSDAMDKLFKANNLSYELDKEAKIFVVKDWGAPQVETITKVFCLKYATVPSSSLKAEIAKELGCGAASVESSGGESSSDKEVGITAAVKKVLSEYGSIIEDVRTNSLVIIDIPSRMPIIAGLIASLDVSAPQVMLEVEMLDVSKNVVDKLGFDLGANPITLILPGGFMRRGADFFLGDLAKRKTDITTATDGSVVLGSTFAHILDFLRTRSDTKYLARPKLLTLNNETAEIKIVTQEAIGIKTSSASSEGMATSSVEPERVETGVSLRVTPQANIETGEITMVLCPKVSEATAGSSFTAASATYRFRDPEIRSTKSVVRIKDGETVIIGGLIRNEMLSTTNKVPFLGDLPLVGFLFRHKGGSESDTTSDKNKERELLVFITPHIIRDANIELAQLKKAAVPQREQNTVSSTSRELTINTSLNNFESRKSRKSN